jgi:hypothetical protein
MTTQCPKCDSENPDTKQFCGDCGTQLIPSKGIPACDGSAKFGQMRAFLKLQIMSKKAGNAKPLNIMRNSSTCGRMLPALLTMSPYPDLTSSGPVLRKNSRGMELFQCVGCSATARLYNYSSTASRTRRKKVISKSKADCY